MTWLLCGFISLTRYSIIKVPRNIAFTFKYDYLNVQEILTINNVKHNCVTPIDLSRLVYIFVCESSFLVKSCKPITEGVSRFGEGKLSRTLYGRVHNCVSPCCMGPHCVQHILSVHPALVWVTRRHPHSLSARLVLTCRFNLVPLSPWFIVMQTSFCGDITDS